MARPTLWSAGIDPGASGAAAAISPKGDIHVAAYAGEEDALAWLQALKDKAGSSLVLCIENPGFFFGGPAGNAQAKLHRNVGFWVGATKALDLHPILVAPQSWQRRYKDVLQDLKGLANRDRRKRALKEIAERKFRTVRVTLKNCDALLIAEHARVSAPSAL